MAPRDVAGQVVELRTLSHAEGHRRYVELHESDRGLACAVGDRDPELHARLSVPPPPERLRGVDRISCERREGRWAVESIKVRGRRNARRARRLHPSAVVTVVAPVRSRILGRAPRLAVNRRRRGSRRSAGSSRGDPDSDEADAGLAARLPAGAAQ